MAQNDAEGGDIVSKLVEQDEYWPHEAVQELVELTKTVSASGKDLGDHAWSVSDAILGAAMDVSHDQQDKLVKFVMQLQKTPVPSAKWPWKVNGEEIWTQIPKMEMCFGDYYHSYSPSEPKNKPEDSRAYENFMAFCAQISELEFRGYHKGPVWSHMALSKLAPAKKATRAEVRCACMWLVYAPTKLRKDVTMEWSDTSGDKFTEQDWARWKKFLQESRSKSDDETKLLIDSALANMNECEAADG